MTLPQDRQTPSEDRPQAVLPPGLDRRGFLRTTAGGGLALALASVLPGCGRDATAQGVTGQDLRSLTLAEYETARAAAEALLIGAPEVIDPGAIALRMDYELWAAGGAIQEDMRTVLQLIERLTPLGGRLRRFTDLDAQERLVYLNSWRDSRFNLRRASFNAVKAFVYFFAYADPATWPVTRFPAPWPGRVRVAVPAIDFGEIA